MRERGETHMHACEGFIVVNHYFSSSGRFDKDAC